ncbi:hypothetical protein ACOMHN_066312 [Nucella lapillus]
MADSLAEDLLEILQPSVRADVRGIAVQQLLGLTGTPEGCQTITQHSKLLDCVLQLLSDKDPGVRKEAVKVVINLTAEETTILALLRPELESSLAKTAASLLEGCLELDSVSQSDAVSLCNILSNLTREADSCRCVAQVLMDSPSLGLAQFVKKLGNLYAKESPSLSAVSTVLMNLTQVPSVRRGLMEAPGHLLLTLLPIISMSNGLSKYKGIVGTVQNCCFEYDFHDWLLSSEADLLPRLLLPLAGPEEFDEDDMERLPSDLQLLPDTKEREADPEVRKMLISSVHKLCSTKAGRAFVKEKNTYVIMRELHKWEMGGENDDSIMDLIDILIWDEPQEDMEDLHKVDIPSHLQEKFLQEGS